jgi:hypothetical protein
MGLIIIKLKSTLPKFKRPELLLHQPIPRPLHGTNPRIIKGATWWNKQRVKAYKKNNYCCWACGVHRSTAKKHAWLEGHEVYDIDYKAGLAVFKEVVALCYHCHAFIHQGRLAAQLDAAEISYSAYRDVVDHGFEVINAAGLESKWLAQKAADAFLGYGAQSDGAVPWSQWRLIIGKKAYAPKIASYDLWIKRYYGKE